MDLSVILTNQEKCSELMVLTSRALEDEFTRLRFPDPDRASKYISAFFLSKGQVDAMQKRDNVEIMCKLVVGFLLRFVTLVAAVTASMHTNEEYLSNLSRLGTTAQSANAEITTERYKEPVSGLQQILGRSPLNSQIISELTTNGKLQQVPKKQTFRFDGQNKVVINIEKAVIFQCYKDKTAIFGIDIQEFVTRTPQQPQQHGWQQPPQQGWQPQPMPTRPDPSISNTELSSFIGRRQGANNGTSVNSMNTNNTNGQTGGRRVTRRRRRQQGGNGNGKFYIVKIMQILNCAGECAKRDEFLINSSGYVFEMQSVQQLQITSNVTFQQRLMNTFDNEPTQYTNEDPGLRSTLENKSYGGLHEKSEKVLNLLQDIRSYLKTSVEGVNPANYRAFLLATALDNGILSTLFCNDAWSRNRFSNTIAYSLLNSLYVDRDDGASESETRIELAGVVTKFVGEGVAQPYLPASNRTTNPQTFDQISFPMIPQNLKAFCDKLQVSQSTITVRKTSQREDIEILTNAHESIRELYNKHIEGCKNILSKALSLKTREYGTPPIIQLEETFFKDERGARAALEDIIREARQLISSHYLNVESVYRRALQNLGRRMTGNYSPASKQAINTNENRLNKVENLLNRN